MDDGVKLIYTDSRLNLNLNGNYLPFYITYNDLRLWMFIGSLCCYHVLDIVCLKLDGFILYLW